MSLFNQIASLLGGEKINQFKTVLEWVETQGGIEGLVKQFNSAGLSELINLGLAQAVIYLLMPSKSYKFFHRQ